MMATLKPVATFHEKFDAPKPEYCSNLGKPFNRQWPEQN